MVYVGLASRVWAVLIDGVFAAAIALPLWYYVFGLFWAGHLSELVRSPSDAAVVFGVPVVSMVFLAIGALLMFDRTPGMRAIGAEIVDSRDGMPVGLGQSVGRYFAGVLSVLALGLGVIWVAFDPRRQTWHDKLAGTVVVRSKHRGPEAMRFDRSEDGGVAR